MILNIKNPDLSRSYTFIGRPKRGPKSPALQAEVGSDCGPLRWLRGPHHGPTNRPSVTMDPPRVSDSAAGDFGATLDARFWAPIFYLPILGSDAESHFEAPKSPPG